MVCKKFNQIYKHPRVPIKELRLIISKNSKLKLDMKTRKRVFEVIGRLASLEKLVIHDGVEIGVVSSFGYQENTFTYSIVPDKDKKPWSTGMTQKGIDEKDVIGAGYFLLQAIKSCPKLRGIELRNVHYLSVEFFDHDFKKHVLKSLTGKGYSPKLFRKVTTNTMYLLAMACKCQNLESLVIPELKELNKEALTVLASERKTTLKVLKLNGATDQGDYLEKLPDCPSLEVLEFEMTFLLGVSGFSLISKLRNLKSLHLCFSKRGENQHDFIADPDLLLLTPQHLIEIFRNGNLKLLEKLSLSGSELMDNLEANEVIKVIALNCPRLKYFDLYKGENRI